MTNNKNELLKTLHQNKQQFEPDYPKEPDVGPEIKGNLNFGPYAAYFKIPQSFREGLLKKGNKVWVTKSNNPNRKLKVGYEFKNSVTLFI